jgi:hypothetical protein
MSFVIRALEKTKFEEWFALSDAELAARRAVRVTATKKPGFPCRVSLADAEPGEEVLLVNYEHQSADSPFRASHAIYVRRGAAQARLQADEVPEALRLRTLSLRAFDAAGMLRAAELAEGTVIEAAIEAMLRDPAVEYVHLHFAKPGCFAARVERA